LLGLFFKPTRLQLTLLQRSIALTAAGWKFSTRYRLCTGNARVSWGMHCAECSTRKLYCLATCKRFLPI